MNPDKWCYTIRQKKILAFKWIIQNHCCSEDELSSTDLPAANFAFRRDDIEYYLTLNLTGGSCEERECQVSLDDNTNTLWKFNVTLSVIDKGTKTHSRTFVLSNMHHTASLQLFDDCKGCLIPNNQAKILCEVTVVQYKTIDSWTDQKFRIIKFKSNLELSELLVNKGHWDVTFDVAGSEVRAHKCILASRSKVFAAMFKHEMEEAKSNKVSISDIELEVFNEMLRYIYTNEVINLHTHATGLLAASDKYDLPCLRALCETELAHNISLDNAIATLILADLYRAAGLKEHAIDFINANRKEVAATEDWPKMLGNYVHLLAELYLKIDDSLF